MFTFPLEPNDLFNERTAQMAAWGIPRAVVSRVRGRIRDMWSDAPGGWVHEWGTEAERVEADDPLLAAALWGAARFPSACTPSRRRALDRQVGCYLRAAPGFPVPFERRTLEGVPTHVFMPRKGGADTPTVILSAGVDTCKMELHRLALALALGGLRVAVIDMPGTGETPGPLTSDSHRVYARVLDLVAGRARRGIIGLSFGGHWAAKLALLGEVDAAVDVGGPVGAVDIDAGWTLRLPNGMRGIIANALGCSELPDLEEAGRHLAAFSLKKQGLLSTERLHKPLLVVNGAQDVYIPIEDTTVFRAFPRAEVFLIRDADHCAGDHFLRVGPSIVAWMCMQLLATRTWRALYKASRLILPARVEPS